MREIKFKVWDGHKIHYPPVVEIGVCGVNGLTSASFQSENGGYTTSAYVMQFTGLYDRNGKEIYEGDVVEKIDIYSEDNSREGVGIVKYDLEHIEFIFSQISGDDYAFYMPDGNNWSKDELAVIGNIYENPELLEVE